jgi:hypothetical protein
MDPLIEEVQDWALTSPQHIPPVFISTDFLIKLANQVKTENWQTKVCAFSYSA